MVLPRVLVLSALLPPRGLAVPNRTAKTDSLSTAVVVVVRAAFEVPLLLAAADAAAVVVLLLIKLLVSFRFVAAEVPPHNDEDNIIPLVPADVLLC